MTGPRDLCAGSGALLCSGERLPGVCSGGVFRGPVLGTARARWCHSAAEAAASMAASERRTWLRSVVCQKSGMEALMKLP